MRIHRSYCVLLNGDQKAALLDKMNERQVSEKWSDDLFFDVVEQMLSEAFLLGLDEPRADE